jgi:hypothetical protein
MSAQGIYECYLWVDSQGKILADKRKRIDSPAYETWQCEYFEGFFRVTRLYPNLAATQTLKIDDGHYEALKVKFQEHSGRKPQNARHESGHAILFYALRFLPVDAIDIRPKAILRGNLYEQARRGWASQIGFIGGTTSPLPSEPKGLRSDTLRTLSSACQGYGGLAACGEGSPGTDGDVQKCRSEIQILAASTHPIVAFSSDPHEEQKRTVATLCDRLKSFACEIIANPVVAARHEQLAQQLLEKEILFQREIEAILVPATLPDYSGRLEEIRKKFLLPEQY